MVTTEHIIRKTQDGIWYDLNTYHLPLYAQHTLRTAMTVVHGTNWDGIHTVPMMADTERYTIHLEANHHCAQHVKNGSYVLLPQARGARRNHDTRMQTAGIPTEWGGSEDEKVDQLLHALNDPGAKELL